MINTALCSFGMSGKVFHAPFINAHKGFSLYAVWERSKKEAAQIYPSMISYDTYDDLLNDSKVDLVIVNTPNYTHFDFTKKALEAGKHVIVEKSFTVTVAEAEELIRLAKIKNKKLSVYHNRRWDSDFKTTKGIFDSKVLGEIVEAEIHFDRFNLGLSAKAHKEEPNAGAGVLHDLGPHIIDQALQLFGKPEAVFADLRIIRPHSVVNDYMDILLFYPSTRVRVKSSYIVKEPLPAFILHGTNGTFTKHRADVQEDALKKGEKPASENWGKEPDDFKGLLHTNDKKETVDTVNGNYMDYYNQVYEAINNNDPLPVTADEALEVMKIIEAAINSNHSKCVVEL